MEPMSTQNPGRADEEADLAVDGRRQRTVRSRARVVEALYEAVMHSDTPVTFESVAARAGVSLSTIRRHFSDFPSLQRAMREHVMTRILPMLAAEPPTGSREQRLRVVVERRREIFEIVMPGMRAHPDGRGAAAELLADRKQLDSVLRAQLALAFPGEFSGKGGSARREMLSTLLSLASWEHLRTIREFTPERCEELLERAALALLDA